MTTENIADHYDFKLNVSHLFVSFQLTPEERSKRRVRRERNKLAAAKCRQRRVDHTNTLVEVRINSCTVALKSFDFRIYWINCMQFSSSEEIQIGNVPNLLRRNDKPKNG